MKQSQSNYLNMARAVNSAFENSRVWHGNVLIEESAEKLKDFCSQINAEATKQELNKTKGHTAQKEQERTLLEDRTHKICGRLRVYAVKHDDEVTAAQVNYSRSSLDVLSLNKLLTTARKAVEIAAELLPSLEVYKVTQEDIDELQVSIDTTEKLNARRDAVKGERTENTSHLANLFSRLRKELKLMDTQVDSYIDDEEFREIYFNTRRIHDIRGGGGKTKAIDN